MFSQMKKAKPKAIIYPTYLAVSSLANFLFKESMKVDTKFQGSRERKRRDIPVRRFMTNWAERKT